MTSRYHSPFTLRNGSHKAIRSCSSVIPDPERLAVSVIAMYTKMTMLIAMIAVVTIAG